MTGQPLAPEPPRNQTPGQLLAPSRSQTSKEEVPTEARNRYLLRGIRRVAPRQVPCRGKCPLYDRHLPVRLLMLNSRW